MQIDTDRRRRQRRSVVAIFIFKLFLAQGVMEISNLFFYLPTDVDYS